MKDKMLKTKEDIKDLIEGVFKRFYYNHDRKKVEEVKLFKEELVLICIGIQSRESQKFQDALKKLEEDIEVEISKLEKDGEKYCPECEDRLNKILDKIKEIK